MRVALDATPLTLSSGGLARYTLELSLALAESFPKDEYLLMSDQEFAMPGNGPPNLKRGGGPRRVLEGRWWLWGLDRVLAREQVELFHGTNFAVPWLPRRPSVLTLHDLSPWMNPEWHGGADRVRQRTPLLLRLRIATMVLTVSEAVRKQAIEYFGLTPGRVVAVPNAAGKQFRPRRGRPLADARGSEASPSRDRQGAEYFLFLGTLEPRKNLEGLLEAWRQVRRQCAVDLVLAGRRRADFRGPGPEPGLRIAGEVPDAELPALYSGALALVYPSWYEGFGLPVLEAMQCGACVIISNDPALHEVAGGAGVEVPPGDPRALAAAMLAAATQPDWLAARREQALRRAREFSWSRTARLTREVYVEAQRRFD